MISSSFEKTKRDNKKYSYDEFEEKVSRKKDEKVKDKNLQQKRLTKRQED